MVATESMTTCVPGGVRRPPLLRRSCIRLVYNDASGEPLL
jgi:hypothetical protein